MTQEMILVDHKGQNLLNIPKTYPTGKNSADSAFVFENVRLLPAINKISKSDWEMIKKHPMIIQRLEDEELVVVEGKKGNEDDKNQGCPDLSKMNVKEASKHIANVVQEELLNEWKSKEKRVGVLKAIDAQLDLIDQKTNPDRKEEE